MAARDARDAGSRRRPERDLAAGPRDRLEILQAQRLTHLHWRRSGRRTEGPVGRVAGGVAGARELIGPCFTGSRSPAPARALIVPHYFRLSSARMSQALRFAANALWPLVRAYNARFERPSPHPKWAPAPLLKRRERTFPPLGWPRETDSLCPRCVKEVRTAILDGERRRAKARRGPAGRGPRATSTRRTARSS